MSPSGSQNNPSARDEHPTPYSPRISHHGHHASRRRSNSVATNRSEAIDTDWDEEDEYLAEPASEEIFSGPVSESVPSAYSSFHHRRYSSRQPSISRRDSSVDRHAPPTFPDNAEGEIASSVGSRHSFSFFALGVRLLNQQATINPNLLPMRLMSL